MSASPALVAVAPIYRLPLFLRHLALLLAFETYGVSWEEEEGLFKANDERGGRCIG